MGVFSWKFYLTLVILSLILQGYFTMMEMAIVSYNKVRLQFDIGKKQKKAIMLGKLLKRPTYLFGTTLIGVNFFLQLGSESARLLYASLGLDPDYALITQIILVVIFAELNPMFAGRRYPESAVIFGIYPLYLLSKMLIPFIWILDGICRFIDWIFASPPPSENYLTRDELQKAIETKETSHVSADQEKLDTVVKEIFEMRSKTPSDLMIPLSEVQMCAFDQTVKEASALLKKKYIPYLPLYYKSQENILGILYTRDLLKLDEGTQVKEIARSPWFITEKNSLFQIIKQFRWNREHLAVVLDLNGLAVGILTLDRLIDEMFEMDIKAFLSQEKVIIDRSFPADTEVEFINQSLGISLPCEREEDLERLMKRVLGHEPGKKEIVHIGRFELELEESPFLADKTIRIRSRGLL